MLCAPPLSAGQKRASSRLLFVEWGGLVMSQYIKRRLLLCIPTLLGITILSFIIVYMAPGDPADMLLRPGISPEIIEAKREALGLNQPIWKQYLIWLQNLLSGNWGYSYSSHQPVLSMINQRLGATLLLMGSSLVLSLLVSLPLGILSALYKNKVTDKIITFFSFFVCSVPGFLMSLGFIYLFSLRLPILPSSGMYTLGTDSSIADVCRHMVLPLSALSLPEIGTYSRYIRGSIIDALGQDYVRTARAKGLPLSRILNIHMLRNALITLISVVGTEIPVLFCGSVVIDRVFSWPGIGMLTMDAVLARDFPVLLGVNFIAAILILLSNLLVDLLYSLINPQIRYENPAHRSGMFKRRSRQP
jgi:peptide/nickel transport system permease protein